MAVEPAFAMVLASASAGLALSVGIERLLTPVPRWSRPPAAWCLHCGVWLLAYGALLLPLGRPWFATFGVSAVLLVLVLVNNAKFRVLREPFVLQDFEYFTDAMRHPRLYIPFLGWGRLALAVLGGSAAVAAGLYGDVAPPNRFAWAGQFGGIAVALGVALLLITAASHARPPVRCDAREDVAALGLLASLWRYAGEGRNLPVVISPFVVLRPGGASPLPNLVAVQSESFFDPRPLFAGIRREVLDEFDMLKVEAVTHGKLTVPAWGANTVRTEFAFLSALRQDCLGVHRFNPYRTVVRGWNVPTVAGFLRGLGYRTISLHPYSASFYLRDRVHPRLGFDEFLDVRAFTGAERFGPYVSDLAVADKVAQILAERTAPVFIFVITMENHGPLHLERVTDKDVSSLYSIPPPEGCDELTVYLRHLRNANRMIAALRNVLGDCRFPASLCWFGDHIPIMEHVYRNTMEPEGSVEYVIWDNRHAGVLSPMVRNSSVHQLATEWLRAVHVAA
ncbi:LTA synthase family protein [Nitratidesulfovibrio termitidis]|uniref:LTA synthase family protein n=1 Tax=Nitratidesulfovibrio termitidis TaxID=42252 RepID=UPI000684B388|nr:LTA synthase family protein [Nitratidesulfovibrio termitidis]